MTTETASKKPQDASKKPVKPLYFTGKVLPEQYLAFSFNGSCALTDCSYTETSNHALLSKVHGGFIHPVTAKTARRHDETNTLKKILGELNKGGITSKMYSTVFVSFRYIEKTSKTKTETYHGLNVPLTEVIKRFSVIETIETAVDGYTETVKPYITCDITKTAVDGQETSKKTAESTMFSLPVKKTVKKTSKKPY
jgi:hypothetical protein